MKKTPNKSHNYKTQTFYNNQFKAQKLLTLKPIYHGILAERPSLSFQQNVYL